MTPGSRSPAAASACWAAWKPPSPNRAGSPNPRSRAGTPTTSKSSVRRGSRRIAQQVGEVVGVLFLGREDLLEHAARGRIVVADVLDHLPVAVDRDALGDEVLADHFLQVAPQPILGVAA